MARLANTSIIGNLIIQGDFKKNNEDLIDIIKKEAGKKGVNISETTSTGSYIRFASGEQIAWKLKDAYRRTTGSGFEYYYTESDMVYPATFLEAPIVAPLNSRLSGVQWGGVRSVTRTSTDIYLISGIDDGATGHAGYIAFGRWK